MKAKILTSTFVALALLGITSCKSTPEIPKDMTAAQLLQAGQDAASSSDYKSAENYFMTTITRFGLDNAIYVEARYELGCVYLKQKKYDKARTIFDEILGMYDDAAFGELPPAFQKLAKLKLDQIPEGK